MSAAERIETTRYARAVERAWNELPGAPRILSPRDWKLVEDWCARGIPLQIVLESIEAAAERLRKSRREPRRPRGLGYVASAVEEAWRVVLEGRHDAERTGGDGHAPAPGAVPTAWRRRLEAEDPESRLAGLLDELIDRLRRGAEPAAIDRQLDERIEAAVSSSLREQCRSKIGEQLAPYRRRMSAAAYEATLMRACSARLREELELPRLESGG
jgi:hypothetical protein